MSSADKSLKEFLAALAARQPTPGGGSASALAGALGAALGSMAALYSSGGDKQQAAATHALEVNTAFAALRQCFLDLVDLDIAAYESFVTARKMPKETPEQQAVRTTAMAQAREMATGVPEAVIEAALKGFGVLEALLPIANPHLAGDAACAAYFLETAARGAAVQVMSNCAASDTEGANARRRETATDNVARCQRARERMDAAVLKMMKL